MARYNTDQFQYRLLEEIKSRTLKHLADHTANCATQFMIVSYDEQVIEDLKELHPGLTISYLSTLNAIGAAICWDVGPLFEKGIDFSGTGISIEGRAFNWMLIGTLMLARK